MAAAAVVLLAAGCSQHGTGRVAPPPTGSSASAQAPVTADGGTDDDADLPPVGASPTWGAHDRTGALITARTAVGMFMGKGYDAGTWWASVQPWLSPTAAAAYAGTDPANVPGRRVTGNPRVVDESSAFLATVVVPTDAGTWQVLESRTGVGAPWLVERFTLPTGQGPSPSSPPRP